MDKNKKIMSLISLSQKAGKLVTGEENCEKALRNKEAKLVIIATDASDNTKKKFTNKSFFYKVKCILFSTKEEISNAISRNNRATIIITDENFANKIISFFSEETN